MRLLRKMIAHYRMLRILRLGRWSSTKATVRTFWNLYVGGRNLERWPSVREKLARDKAEDKRRHREVDYFITEFTLARWCSG
jgi:hypothetical protein